MKPPRIMVVDDEQHIVQVLSLTLRKAGYDVACADDGDAAWDAIQRQRPDLLITDQAMTGMTGTELARQVNINSDNKPVPVLIVTARQPLPDADADPAVAAVLPKPFSPRQVLAHVHDLVGPSTARQETPT